MFLDEVLHDLGIDGCFPDIFSQCAVSHRPRPVTDDVILQGAVSYGHGPALLLHPARFWATAVVVLFHCYATFLGCPIRSGMTTLYLCHRQSKATDGRFSASENTTSLTSLPFGMGPSVLI